MQLLKVFCYIISCGLGNLMGFMGILGSGALVFGGLRARRASAFERVGV